MTIRKRTTIVWLTMLCLLAGCRKTAKLGKKLWLLVSYGPVDAPLTPAGSPSISFDNNGRVGGFTGCNTFNGHYEADEGRIMWRDNELAFTVMGCGPASSEGMQDEFFRKWLPGARTTRKQMGACGCTLMRGGR